MKLISSKKTKRRIALTFVFAFMLSNLLSLVGPSAQAAVTITSPSAGTCFQHSSTVASGALVTVYSIGTIQISLTSAEISPGSDLSGAGTTNAATARATLTGSVSAASDVIGNVFSIIPPTGTNFVVVPGFQDVSGANLSNHIAAANATISNAISADGTTTTPDSNLAISVGVITTGTAGIGRAIVAIARDATTGGGGGTETYPKTNTGSNTATVSITGLGIAIPPSGEGALSGTLQATLDANPPSGIGAAATQGADGGASTTTAAAAIPGLSGTINICTVTSAAGQLQAELDTDTDTTDLYDKQAAAANLLALGQLAAGTSAVHAFDTTTLTTAVTVNGTAGGLVDLEPILIRGTAGTGTATRDQVFATGTLLADISAAANAPSGTSLDITTAFGNAVTAPITVTFTDDNATATTALQAVDINISSSTAGTNAPTAAGFGGNTSRSGFLGALRAAVLESNNATTITNQSAGTVWGVASVNGGPGTVNVQESQLASSASTTAGISALGTAATGNGTLEPFTSALVDLRILCTTTTNPVAGWFALLTSTVVATPGNFGTTSTITQVIKQSQAGGKINYTGLQSGNGSLFTQSLTNIAGTNPTVSFLGGRRLDDTTNTDNAILYASCSNNTLTIVPIQNGFDATRDVIAVTPRLLVTNISNTLSSDVNIIAQVSGNNLTGTTSLNLAKLVGVPATGGTSSLASAQGVALSEAGQLGVDCTSGSTSSVVLSGVSAVTLDSAVSGSCTSGAIASPGPLFVGGANNTVSGTTIVKGSPTVQGEGRGILIKEATATGFSELVSQVGGGVAGTLFETALPTGCDLVDDNDDNNTASSSSSTAGAPGGNDITMITVTSTAGVTASITGGGTGDAALTSSNVLVAAVGTTPAKVRFRLSAATGTGTDATTTDAVLVRFDAQDILCPSTTDGTDLTGTVTAQNKVSAPTITSSLGNMVSFGKASKALAFAFADDVATSTKKETSTNTKIGTTPRLVGGSNTTSHPFKVTELNAKGIPIGGRVSPRNIDPDNSLLSTVVTRGQIWVVPNNGSVFATAPAAADVSFSDNSLVVDGNPLLVTSSSVDVNAPLGTLIIGLKRNTASGALDPATQTTTVTVKNLVLTAATSSTTDAIASVEFFAQDVGVIVNTPGIAASNNASSPTVFTPYNQGSTKALTQLEQAGVQLSGSLSNQLLTNRLAVLETAQVSPFANSLAAGTAMAADGTKITTASAAVAMDDATPTDNTVTVTGAAGSVYGGAQVLVTTGGSTAYDSVTVVASTDGSFAAKVRGDCMSGSSIPVSVTASVSGTSTASVSKTALCQGATETEDTVFGDIAGSDGKATIAEVLAYISGKGGLSAVITAGGPKLAGVIKAARSALGLS